MERYLGTVLTLGCLLVAFEAYRLLRKQQELVECYSILAKTELRERGIGE